MFFGIVLVATLLFFLIFGTPIAVSVGLATILAMLTAGDTAALPAITQKMFTSIDSFPLLALPLFTLSGELMEISGISERLVRFMKMLFRKLPAPSACITSISCAFFGAISGSAPATSAAIGGIMIDPMKKAGYSGTEAAAVTASSASLGIIIPPSIPMVVFATTASVSVGSLFMAGVIPGIILCIAFCIMHGFRFGHVETPTKEKLTVREAVTTFWDAIFALGMPVIILGGIYGGFFTPTEAAAVSCVYALVVGCFIYRNLSAKQIWRSLCEISVRVSSMLTIVCVATAMAWFVSSSGLAKTIAEAVLAGFSSKIALLTVINILLFILGCLIDPTSIILLTCPIIIPITQSLGMSSVAVGAFMIMNIAVGMVTPPFAGTLYVANQIAGEKSIAPITLKLWPYIVLMFAITLLVAYVPDISLLLPKFLGMTI